MSTEKDNVIRVNFGAGVVEPPPPEPEEPASPEAAEKLAIFTEMVAEGTVMVTLDTRVSGVIVPPDFQGNLQLNLNFDHDYGIRDFDYDSQGVRASLSFGGVNKLCDIPWDAVYILRNEASDDAVAFPESLPPELQALIPQFQQMLEEEEEEEE